MIKIINIILASLWVTTLAIFICWLKKIPIGVEHEPLVGILVVTSAGLTGIARYYSIQLSATTNKLSETQENLQSELFSTPIALAFGYVKNFLEPAIRALLVHDSQRRKQLQFFIYIPEILDELDPPSRDRVVLRIREKKFKEDVVNLELKEGRSRDILTVKKSANSRPLYFDFPNTLLTLIPLIDYKVHSKKDSFSDEEKKELGRVYIAKFKETIEQEAEQLGISQYIKFTDKHLRHFKD